MVHRYNANANTRNKHVNHENANASTSASTRSGKKYSCTSIALLFTHANLGNANTNRKVRWKNTGCIGSMLLWLCEKDLDCVYVSFLSCICIGCVNMVCFCICTRIALFKHVNQVLGSQRFYQAYRDANLWRSKLWRLSFFSLSPPPPTN